MRESLQVLDHVRLNFSPGAIHILNIALAFIMFGVALDINLRNFKEMIQKPKSLFTGFISQFLLLPFFTFLVVVVLQPTPTVALGMILVSACPGGNISNFMSSLAKGNVALSVSLTAISTVGAILFTPINFSFWGKWYVKYYSNVSAVDYVPPIEIEMWQMFQTVTLLLGLPVVLGLLFAHKLPRLTEKIKKYVKGISIVFFIVLVFVMIHANWDSFKQYVPLVFIIVLIHNVLALTTGFTFSSIMRRPSRDRRTITIETGIQNSGLALAIMFNPKIFPPELELGGMTIIAAWWGVWHIISGLSIASLWARKKIVEA